MALKSKNLNAVRADVPVTDVAKAEVVRINLNVPEQTRKAWKLAALKLDKDMTSMIVEAVSSYIDTHVSK